MGDMVEDALDGMARKGIALELVDAMAPVGERLLYRSGVEGHGEADPPAADASEARASGLSWATTIELAGRRWELRMTPTLAYLAAHRPWQAWGVLAGGLLFTGLLGGFLLLVTGRTAQLEAVNQQLAIEIAERTRAEEALRQSEAHYRTLFDSHPHPLWVYDLDTLAFRVVNDAAVAHYGYSRGEFLAMTIRDIRPPEDLPALAENLSILPPGLDMPDHCRHQRKDGTLIDVEVTSHGLCFEGRAARLVLAQDITVRRQAEAEREQLQAQLRQTYKMEAIGTLAGGIAHDFNNILATILGYTELALDNVPSESATWRQLQEVLTAAHRAKDLVQQILTFSRKSEQPRQPVPLQQIVHDALRLLRASLPTTIAIRQRLNAPSGTVFADPTQLHQVLMNLGSNAEHAMRETGGLLEVYLEELEVTANVTVAHPPLQPGAYLRLTIADTGCGMAPEIVERIFEPFFTTKGVGEGTGLGLAVVHGIITDHGGAITVMSAPAEGTTFTLYLPRCARAAEATHEEPPLLSGQARVLWVDDEVALARWGEQTLARLGYDVTAYTSSVEALEAFRAAPHHFDLIITDHTMPYLTGEALTQAVRRIRPDIPIILCTGFSHTMTAKKAAALGIQAYLTKPLGTRELSLAMRQILDQPYPEGEHDHGPYSAHR
jgi:PAS domain S-box-containing protein